jgi:hypothetical protein
MASVKIQATLEVGSKNPEKKFNICNYCRYEQHFLFYRLVFQRELNHQFERTDYRMAQNRRQQSQLLTLVEVENWKRYSVEHQLGHNISLLFPQYTGFVYGQKQPFTVGNATLQVSL